MSNKQKADLDDGYIRIANTLFCALFRLPIFSYEARVLLFIIYQTYGYNHKERELSCSYIGNGLGIAPSNVNRAVKKLESMKVIHRRLEGKRKTQIIGVNTHTAEWSTIIKSDNRTVIKSDNIKSDNSTIIESDNRTIINSDNKYNTDQYKTDKYKTECVGASPHDTQKHPVFLKLWREWKWSQASMDKVPLKTRTEIESIGYLRMTDAAKRYQQDFESRTTKNNQPLSARTWFTGAYVPYLPQMESSGIWYNIDGRKCKGEREYF